jgi:hypothetical protein
MPDINKPTKSVPSFNYLDNPRLKTDLTNALNLVYEYFERRLKVELDKSKQGITSDLLSNSSLIADLGRRLVGSNTSDPLIEEIGSGVGDIESVSITLPSILTGGGSFASGAASFNITLTSQSANLIFSSPDGSSGAPAFRALVLNDLPILGRLDRTSSIADPTNVDIPTTGQASIHKNTTSGNIFLAYNNGGVIVKVQLV